MEVEITKPILTYLLKILNVGLVGDSKTFYLIKYGVELQIVFIPVMEILEFLDVGTQSTVRLLLLENGFSRKPSYSYVRSLFFHLSYENINYFLWVILFQKL